jgi:hypothetical protein
MSGNHDTRTVQALNLNNGHLIAGNIMEAIKECMLLDEVMKTLFAQDGSRIFISDVPSYNETIVPLFEMYYQKETFRSNTAYFDGTLLARIVLPTSVQGKLQEMRRVGAIFQRFLGSSYFNANIFPKVPGLISLGYESEFSYDKVLQMTGFALPFIEIILPFRIDMLKLQNDDTSYDIDGPLDSDEIGWIESHLIKLAAEDDNQQVVTEIEVLSETGQTN